VHIADVSHFVQEKTPLDEEARLRTTTVYLVHKAIPMLPHLLCQNLCSLNPGLERLTFSCFFYVSADGTVLEDRAPRITKSIIKTCIRFDYDLLQEVFDGKITDEKDLPVLFYPSNNDLSFFIF
jgi:exoribonuclease R